MKRLLACLVGCFMGLFLVGALSGCGTAVVDSPASASASGVQSSAPSPSSDSASESPKPQAGQGLAPDSPTTALRTVRVSELPSQAVDTLRLIAAGGPFPYSKDGATFSNREGILPRKPKGFYEEYTVKTPGSQDRGARRIVSGRDGSRFYTSDHYSSFREVVSG